MMMVFAIGAGSAIGVAHAGDMPLYEAAPAWVTAAPLKGDGQAYAQSPALVIFDIQQRMENGVLWAYSDTATRIASAEMLAQAATIAIPWMPDKGDFIVHELSILRGTEHIDLLARGQKFTILRREEAMEQRELTGILTATLAVEGLQVGDILRVRASVTARDAALGGNVQSVMPILATPMVAEFGRLRFSWPTTAAPNWKLLAEGVKAVPVRQNAYTELTIALPAAKQPEMPLDAPARFRHPPLIELATFKDWADVSKTMAPLYFTDNLIAADGPIAAEVARIMAAEPTKIGRAARALELVQDKIRYFAVGMDGGNYVPQSPALTWERRYGDCKAKTLLLLAILRAMDIEAEPVAAHVGLGDFVADRLPSLAAFNHILVRAVIDGESLWLDGTHTGTRLADLRDTPPLYNVLPLRAEGAALLKVEMHADARPVIDISLDADESASVDLPSAFEATAVVHGEAAAMLKLAKAQLAEKEQREVAAAFLQQFVGTGQFADVAMSIDAPTGDVTIKGRGVTTTNWFTEERRRKRYLSRIINMVSFSPDRSKATWANVPVTVPEPAGMIYRLRLRLPQNGVGFAIDGKPAIQTRVAGYNIATMTELKGDTLLFEERVDSLGGEIAPAQIPAERDNAATATAQAPVLIAPIDVERRWDLKPARLGASTQVKAIEATFAEAIADDPEQNSGYVSRAAFRSGISDHKGALADLDRAIAIAPSIELYLRRASIQFEQGNRAAALSDAEAARQLDPSSIEAVHSVSEMQAEQGDLARGVALLDQRIALGGEKRPQYREMKAALIGEYGDAAEGLRQLDTLIGERPGVPSLLNARCWLKGTRSVEVDTALKDCTAAIELSGNSIAPRDSRALIWYRLGRYDEALADLDAVLAEAPGKAESRFLRAAVLRKLDRQQEAVRDMQIALQLRPGIERQYARYGFK